MDTNDIMFIAFLVAFAIIILEWRMKCPLGSTMVVICLIPPFIKRVRIYDHRWIGLFGMEIYVSERDRGDIRTE